MNGKAEISLEVINGLQSAIQLIKYLLAGADEAMTAYSLYKNGIPYFKAKNMDLNKWMYKMGFYDISFFRGCILQQNISNPAAYESANYIKILEGTK